MHSAYISHTISYVVCISSFFDVIVIVFRNTSTHRHSLYNSAAETIELHEAMIEISFDLKKKFKFQFIFLTFLVAFSLLNDRNVDSETSFPNQFLAVPYYFLPRGLQFAVQLFEPTIYHNFIFDFWCGNFPRAIHPIVCAIRINCASVQSGTE